uniref:Uncharacterized protein n=1 Tax=Strigamia maritima TaxID=126957 RepID=T1IY15_STRMM
MYNPCLAPVSSPILTARCFAVGDAVYAREYLSKDIWAPGIITKKVSSTTYLVKVAKGVWNCHIDQLRSRSTVASPPSSKGGVEIGQFPFEFLQPSVVKSAPAAVQTPPGQSAQSPAQVPVFPTAPSAVIAPTRPSARLTKPMHIFNEFIRYCNCVSTYEMLNQLAAANIRYSVQLGSIARLELECSLQILQLGTVNPPITAHIQLTLSLYLLPWGGMQMDNSRPSPIPAHLLGDAKVKSARAVIGGFTVVCFPLYLAGISWTLVYDTIYTHQDMTDDLIVGIKSTALTFGKHTRQWLTLFSTSMIMNLSAVGVMAIKRYLIL